MGHAGEVCVFGRVWGCWGTIAKWAASVSQSQEGNEREGSAWLVCIQPCSAAVTHMCAVPQTVLPYLRMMQPPYHHPPSPTTLNLHSPPSCPPPPPHPSIVTAPPLRSPHLWVHLALMLMAPNDQVQEGRQVAFLQAVLGGGAVLHAVLVQHKHIEPVVCAARLAAGRAQPGGRGKGNKEGRAEDVRAGTSV